MPLSIANLSNNRRTFTLDTESGPVRITYKPYEMTPAREAAIARLSDSTEDDLTKEGDRVAQTEAGNQRIIENFCTVVEAWDLVGPLHNRETGTLLVEDGEPVPVIPEMMRFVSSYFMIQVLSAIGEDARPKKGQQKRPSDS